MSDNLESYRRSPDRQADWPGLGPVCRLGLATRGNTSLEAEDIQRAVDAGVNYFNWCRHPDGLQQWIRGAGERRRDVLVAVQFFARTAEEARRELDECLEELQTDYVDVATYYYVESPGEWEQIVSTGGAAEVLEAAREEGQVLAIGLTSHQRLLAAEWARSGRLDMLMIRYNAAHRGAEHEVFPTTVGREMPLVAFTCLRWGALSRPTPEDPAGFVPADSPEWYRWVLCQPAVTVALAAPDGRAELEADLALLEDWRGFEAEEFSALCEHGERVYRLAGGFP